MMHAFGRAWCRVRAWMTVGRVDLANVSAQRQARLPPSLRKEREEVHQKFRTTGIGKPQA